MAEAIFKSDSFVNELTKNYMDKLFYFCLKKTGDSFEAENLTSDILLNIVSSLERGDKPNCFSAWVWQIARNRYSVWAKRKHNRNEWLTGNDINDYEIADNNAKPEDKLMQSENMYLLRRELAFISSEYRNIIVAYYIEDRKISDIAISLNLPEGTVKTKLFRARKVLKEGMDMAKEFGVRSYKPEDVRFVASGNQPSGLPWKAVQRKIPKNILLEADNNPSTIEELALALGTAVPYMEEEVEILERATLLKKIGNKYITNFFISSKECQLEVYNAQRKRSKERSEIIDKIVTDSLESIRKLGIVPNHISDTDLKWWAIIYAVEFYISNVQQYDFCHPEKRDNGETWGFIGFENLDLPESCFIGKNGSGSKKCNFLAYKISDYGLWDRVGEMDYIQAAFFGDVIKNNRNASSFTETELDVWKGINGRFAHLDDDGNIIPDILVIEKSKLQEYVKILMAHPLCEKIIALLSEAYDETVKILKKSGNAILEKQFSYCAAMQISPIIMMTVHDEVAAGRLIVPENPNKSTIAMWLEFD